MPSRVRVRLNRSIDSTKILYLIHGGAWLAGDKSDYDTIIPSFLQQLPQYAIVNINYRLATFTGTVTTQDYNET